MIVSLEQKLDFKKNGGKKGEKKNYGYYDLQYSKV